MKGCVEALDLNFKKKLPATEAEAFDATTGGGKEKKKSKMKNALAMSYLTLAMESLNFLKTIQVFKSANLPGGLACDLVEKLTKKYRLDDVVALAKMITKLSKLKMGKNDNPEDIEDDIAAIENDYRCVIE